MDTMKLEEYLHESKKGNELIREKLIRHYKPYIINTVGHLCKRYVTWSDEESSIGLIAFNRAIDTYDQNAGRSFLNFVYLLIKRDLIDYLRKQKKEPTLSLQHGLEAEDTDINTIEVDQSIANYEQSVQKSELVEEIIELNEALSQYNIALEELEYHSPKHQDTREMLLEMASSFIQDEKCVEELLQKKRLPISGFARNTQYRPKTIERHRKYLITLILLKLHPHWVHLTQFIHGVSGKEGSA